MSARAPGATTKAEVGALLAEMDQIRKALKKLVRSADHRTLNRRPAPGQWSPLENVRHLLWAEQLHFRRVLQQPPQWSALGLPDERSRRRGRGMSKRFAQAGIEQTREAQKVLRAWDRAHATTRTVADVPDEAVRRAFQRNIKHLRSHSRNVERLLREAPR